MTHDLNCPVCRTQAKIPQDMTGKKLTCASCESVHRVRPTDDGIELQVLIENLDWQQAAEIEDIDEIFEDVASDVAAPVVVDEPESAPPRLKTWKDKVRAEGGRAAGTGRRRIG